MGKVSIIIPIFNDEKYINYCVDSILKQTYQNIEVILVNDGSIDNSKEICDRYQNTDKRVVVINKENGGVSSARNVGIKQSSGKYIMFVDGDDWIEINTVSKLVDLIQKNGVDAYLTNAYYKDESVLIPDNFKLKSEDEVVNSDIIMEKHLKYRMISSVCFGIYKSDLVKKCGFDEKIHTLEDWEFLFRFFCEAERIGLTSYSFYHYRTNMNSASTTSINEKKLTCFMIPRKVEKILEEKKKMDLIIYVKCLNVIFLNLIMISKALSVINIKKYNVYLKKIAKNNFQYALKNKELLTRQKVYCFMIMISPEIFRYFYRIKHRRELL